MVIFVIMFIVNASYQGLIGWVMSWRKFLMLLMSREMKQPSLHFWSSQTQKNCRFVYKDLNTMNQFLYLKFFIGQGFYKKLRTSKLGRQDSLNVKSVQDIIIKAGILSQKVLPKKSEQSRRKEEVVLKSWRWKFNYVFLNTTYIK